MDVRDQVAPSVFRVIINHEEQYSYWPLDESLPQNWRETGVCGTKTQCLNHIEEVWTDLRPLSVRNQK